MGGCTAPSEVANYWNKTFLAARECWIKFDRARGCLLVRWSSSENPRSVNAAPRLERSEDSKAFFSRRVSIDLSIVNDPRFPAKLWLNYVRGSIRRDSEGNWKMIHRVRLSIPSGVIARVILNLTLRERRHARPGQAHSVSHDQCISRARAIDKRWHASLPFGLATRWLIRWIIFNSTFGLTHAISQIQSQIKDKISNRDSTAAVKYVQHERWYTTPSWSLLCKHEILIPLTQSSFCRGSSFSNVFLLGRQAY